MSSNVWQIGQNTDAQTMYEVSSYKQGGFRIVKDELKGLAKITNMCTEMSATFDEVLKDQNNYIIEFDKLEDAFKNQQDDYNKEIEKLIAEIKVLERKNQDGTITDAEKEELAAKKGKLNELFNNASKQYNDNKTVMDGEKADIRNEFGQKEKIANDYGNLAVDKGSTFINKELKEKQEKNESIKQFKYFINGTFKKHVAGTAAVAAGNKLLDQVKDSALIDKKITEKNNK